MSKKSRKRNKKILAMLALAGGATMLGRRKKASIADMDDAGIGVTHPTLTGSYITKKAADVVEPAVTLRKPPIGRMRGVGTDAEAIAGQDLRAGLSKRVRGVLPPSQLLTPQRSHARGVGLRMKKGGRVTGAAKRGFGRALMKGKK